jgi:hypothetical protein
VICRYFLTGNLSTPADHPHSWCALAADFPSLLYPKDGYDADDIEAKLLQNPIAVRVSNYILMLNTLFLILFSKFFRSIFTSPGSAILENGGKTKAKGCQAKLNGMTEVTPGSIAYTYVLVSFGRRFQVLFNHVSV